MSDCSPPDIMHMLICMGYNNIGIQLPSIQWDRATKDSASAIACRADFCGFLECCIGFLYACLLAPAISAVNSPMPANCTKEW